MCRQRRVAPLDAYPFCGRERNQPSRPRASRVSRQPARDVDPLSRCELYWGPRVGTELGRSKDKDKDRKKKDRQVTVELRVVGFGKEVMLKQRRQMRRNKCMSEEERAAVLLMALSSGVIYAS
nr:unnamed protein product [Digitaria exilis]